MPWKALRRTLKSRNLPAAPASGCCPSTLKPRLFASSSETPARSWMTRPASSISAPVVFSVAPAWAVEVASVSIDVVIRWSAALNRA